MDAPTGSGRRRLPAGERREQLLDVALELAAGGDVGLISVGDLASRAGVSEGLLYHYFPTKHALVVAAVRRAAQALLADLHRTTQAGTGSVRERLEAGLAGYLHHVQTQPTGWRALLAAHSGELAEIAADVNRQSQALILDILGVPAPDPALLMAVAGWEAFERQACVTWLDHPAIGRTAVAEVLLATFVTALSAVAPYSEDARVALERLSA